MMRPILAAIFLAILSRAEIIERVRAAPVTKQNGLVQVIANCPRDIREEFQTPIASFVANICATLQRATRTPARRFNDPGIIIFLGDTRTNQTDVIVRHRRQADGSVQARFFLPAPAFSDLSTLRRETVKAYFLATKNETIDDAEADRRLRAADPDLRVADAYDELAKWFDGQKVAHDDEHYIRLSRAILKPGFARTDDVLHFASRLWIYPEIYSAPFCGKFAKCSFREAIDLAKVEPRIRFLALEKSPQVVLFGGGRGDKLSAAAEAYSVFLRELAVYQKSADELRDLLATADEKLNLAFEDARLATKEQRTP